MDIKIRLASPNDLRSLAAIEQDAAQIFRCAEGLEWIADLSGAGDETYGPLVEAGTVWVAERAAVPVGFLAAQVEASYLYITEISVTREYQRQGVARQLVQSATQEAKKRALNALTLTTFRDIAWNEPLYAKLGFKTFEQAAIPSSLLRRMDADHARGLLRQRRCAMRLVL